MYFIFKAITILSSFLSVDAIPNRKLQLLGNPTDEHRCVSDGGYQWCESTQSCVRPWITPCNTNINTNNNYCSNSPLQLCRMMCPPVNCPTGKCAMRSGSCCDYRCIDDVSHSIRLPPVLPLPPPPPPPQQIRSNNIPDGCTTWFDGCNTCNRNGPTDPMRCTMMLCLRQGTPECRGYATGYRPSLPTQNSQLNQRCAIGFCENLQDCPRCSSGLTCQNSVSSICAGTCYGTCQHPIRH